MTSRIRDLRAPRCIVGAGLALSLIFAFIFADISRSFAYEDPTINGSGFSRNYSGVKHRATARDSSITLSLKANGRQSNRPSEFTSGQQAAGPGSGTQPAAWDPDTDPAFQKALRDRLMSNEDSIFFLSLIHI